MKKASLLIITFYIASLTYAQKFSAGAIAGTGNGWTNYKQNEYGTLTKNSKSTRFYGVQLLLKTIDHIYFTGNVVISEEGFALNNPDEPNYTNFNMKYIRMNVQPVYYPLKSSSVIQPKVSAGFSGAYLIDGYSYFRDPQGNELNFKTKELVKSKFDFGYRLEAGIDLLLSRSIRLTTSAAYYNGTTRIPASWLKLENRNLTYNAGILFLTSKR